MRSLLTSALVGAISVTALPAWADDFDPSTYDGMIPCGTFVIEREIDGDTFTSTPFTNVTAEITNYETQPDVIRVNGRDYAEVQVAVVNGTLSCTGIPLDNATTAAGS